MEVTVRRIMRVAREVDAYLLAIPELSNYFTVPPERVRGGINIIRHLAKKADSAWETFVPELEIAHAGVHQAIEIRDMLVKATDIQEAVDKAKDFYEDRFKKCL